jgi:hypothetical protein
MIYKVNGNYYKEEYRQVIGRELIAFPVRKLNFKEVKLKDGYIFVKLDNSVSYVKPSQVEESVLIEKYVIKSNVDSSYNIIESLHIVTMPDGRQNKFIIHHHPDCCGETFINLMDRQDTDVETLATLILFKHSSPGLNNISFYESLDINFSYIEDILKSLSELLSSKYNKINYNKITDNYYTIYIGDE